ncbi:unnamed protein product, partial [Rotaria sp. Silwood1]
WNDENATDEVDCPSRICHGTLIHFNKVSFILWNSPDILITRIYSITFRIDQSLLTGKTVLLIKHNKNNILLSV